MPETILITGALGFIGHHFVNRLVTARPEAALTAADRNPVRPFTLPAEVDYLSFDLTEPLNAVMRPDIVVHLAGEKAVESRMEAVNRDGTARLLEWSLSCGVKRFIYLSSVGIYGAPYNGGTITEPSPACPANQYEKSKYEAEQLVRKAGKTGRLDTVILRPSNVIGRVESGDFPLLNLIRMIQRGWFAYFGKSGPCFNYIAAEDVADALSAVVSAERPGAEYILNTPVLLRAAIETIADELKTAPPNLVLPDWGGRLAANLASAVSSLTARGLPFSRERYHELTNQTCFDGSLITRELGFAYPTGILQALRNLVRFYLEKGLV